MGTQGYHLSYDEWLTEQQNSHAANFCESNSNPESEELDYPSDPEDSPSYAQSGPYSTPKHPYSWHTSYAPNPNQKTSSRGAKSGPKGSQSSKGAAATKKQKPQDEKTRKEAEAASLERYLNAQFKRAGLKRTAAAGRARRASEESVSEYGGDECYFDPAKGEMRFRCDDPRKRPRWMSQDEDEEY